MQNLKNIYHFFQRLIAKYYLKLFPKVEIIGVTGSVGKTTTKEMIASVLSEKYKIIATKANIDPIYNIPLTIFRLRPGVKNLIAELSVDHFGDMDNYFFMIKPKIGVFTPIYFTHTEFLKDINGVIKEKGKLAEILPRDGFLLLNKDDKNSEIIAQKTRAKVYYYGLSKEADIYACDIKDKSWEGLSFSLCEKGKKEKINISLPLLGKQNVYCALAAALLGKISGLSFSQIKSGLEKISPLPGRMNLIKLKNGAFLIDDSYNANPLGVKSALEAVGRLNIKGKKIAVLGEMKELGDYAILGHEEIGEAVILNNFDILITFGNLTKFTLKKAKNLSKKIKTYEVNNIGEIIKILEEIIKKEDIILLKGSRFSHMERIILGLEGKKIFCNKITCKVYKNCKNCENILHLS